MTLWDILSSYISRALYNTGEIPVLKVCHVPNFIHPCSDKFCASGSPLTSLVVVAHHARSE